MWVHQNFTGRHVWDNRGIPPRMLKKARLLTRPALARRDAPCPKQGRSSTADPRLTFHVLPFTVLEIEARTKLADFFSILLVQLLGTVEPNTKLDRTMVGFAAAAGAGNLGSPVCGFVVKSAECFSALGDGRPGFAGSGDIGHNTASGEGDVTALRGLSFCHTETTSLFCRGV
jgi:hypothetical protein